MSLTTGKGPLSSHRAGRFTDSVPDGVAYVEPWPRRVRGVVGDKTVIDTERALLAHRPDQAPAWLFPADDVNGIASEPDPDAPGYVSVDWRLVDEWYEEDDRALGHPRNPYHRVDILQSSRHLRVDVEGEVLVDTTETVALFETSLAGKLYVARDKVRMDLLAPSTTTTYCPYKGTATHFNAVIGDTVVEDVAWSYEDPVPECLPIKGLLSFYDTRTTLEHNLP
jgi:uncharacterized protein (DUF427 family)